MLAEFHLQLDEDKIRLGELLHKLAEKFPDFGNECVDQRKLGKSISANLDGEKFISDPDFEICAGQSLLILSADAGG